MSCGNPHETKCSEVLSRVYEYLDGELGEHDVAKIRQHLEECRPCLSQYDLDLALKALLRRSCGCEAAPEDLRTRIMVRITEVRAQYRS
jgi:mycothiol system anti-sigma-R factor